MCVCRGGCAPTQVRYGGHGEKGKVDREGGVGGKNEGGEVKQPVTLSVHNKQEVLNMGIEVFNE